MVSHFHLQGVQRSNRAVVLRAPLHSPCTLGRLPALYSGDKPPLGPKASSRGTTAVRVLSTTYVAGSAAKSILARQVVPEAFFATSGSLSCGKSRLDLSCSTARRTRLAEIAAPIRLGAPSTSLPAQPPQPRRGRPRLQPERWPRRQRASDPSLESVGEVNLHYAVSSGVTGKPTSAASRRVPEAGLLLQCNCALVPPAGKFA